jgi:phytoene desaturase
MTRRVLVAGGGIGGLSAAVRLAAAGQRVTLFEQNAALGGKMSELQADGFRWDTGPSVITMRPVFDEVFALAGRTLPDYLTLTPVDPLTRYFFPDGSQLDASRMPHIMISRLRAFAGEADAQGYMRYLQYASRIHEITGPVFIYNDPPTAWRVARTPLRDIPAVDPLRTMDEAIRSFVHSPRLQQLLGRFATYVGASPFLAPATLNVIAHVELSGGVWYPRGGIYAIARAFETLARELGVEIVTGARVEQIVVEDGRAAGVRVAGESIAADAVIADIDVATVYERLLPAGSFPERRLRRLTGAEPSCSGFILMLGVQGEEARLAHHNILFSNDYAAEFRDIFSRGVPPNDPTIYVAITSKTDAGHAPPGCENWFVLVNAPALGDHFDWTTQAADYRERVLAALGRFGFDLHGRILSERMLTPVDLERMSGARRGALYGLSSNDRFNALRRPHNRAPDIRRLYFAGGTTHPGGGVPMVTLSGKVAARMALEDLTRE